MSFHFTPDVTTRRVTRIVALAAALALVAGCSNGSATDPDDNQVAEYFEALSVNNPVDRFAAEGSAAEANGAYSMLSSQAEKEHAEGDAPDLTVEVEEVEGGYDMHITEPEDSGDDATEQPTVDKWGDEIAGPYEPTLIEYRDIETSDEGKVSSYTVDGTPVGASMWTSGAPVEGDGLELGRIYAATNPNGVFIVTEVTNTSEYAATFNGVLLEQDTSDDEHLSDPALSLYPEDGLEPGDATVVSFGNPMMDPVEGEPVEFLIEMWNDDDTVFLAGSTTLEPFNN